MQQQCGHICAAGALSHEKAHAVNLIGTPEIKTATSSTQEIAQSTPDPFPAWGLGLGTRLVTSWNIACGCVFVGVTIGCGHCTCIQ